MSVIKEFNACMTTFWHQHQAELYHFLLARTANPDQAADMMQELFLKARATPDTFCDMAHPLAWLYRAARNMLIDQHRLKKEFTGLTDDMPQSRSDTDPVAQLERCLPETLQAMPEDEAWLIEQCDIFGRPQQQLADELNITLAALKSRLLRARTRLREKLIELCEIEPDGGSAVCCHKNMN